MLNYIVSIPFHSFFFQFCCFHTHNDRLEPYPLIYSKKKLITALNFKNPLTNTHDAVVEAVGGKHTLFNDHNKGYI